MDSRRKVRSQDLAGWLMPKRAYPNERRFRQEDEQIGSWSVTLVIEELKPLARAVTHR